MLQPLTHPFTSFAQTLRTYRLSTFRHDLVAGLSVAVVEVPQAMAYAVIAGVSPVYGLYASIIQGFIGALFSSSNHLITGPTNTQSLLIASVVTRLADPQASPQTYLNLVFALALLKGLIQLGFTVSRMGNLARYVSRSVIVGLMSGVGVLIFVGQLPAFFGVHERVNSQLPGVIGPVQVLLAHLNDINPYAVILGAGTLVVVVVARRISPFIPGALIGVVGAAAAVWMVGLTHAQLPLVSDVVPSLPTFVMPVLDWPSVESLLGGALALALFGMIESVAIAKSLAAKTDQRVSPNQELLTQGLANTVSSFFQAIPGSASFTRSALAQGVGGRTRFTALINVFAVTAIFLLFGHLIHYIPQASLAAVLLLIAIGLVNWSYLPRTARASRSDAIVYAITFAATLLVPLEYAVFIGVFLNIGLFIRRTSRLHIEEVVHHPDAYIERPLREGDGESVVRFCQIDGDLFFGLADELEDKLGRLVHSDAQVIILRLKRTHSIDATVLHVIEQITRDLHARNKHLVLCGVRPELMDSLRSFGLIDLLGQDNVFEADVGVFTSAKRAIHRAQQLVGRPDPASSGFHYEI